MGHGTLLLRRIGLLHLLLLPHISGPSQSAEEGAHPGPDGRPLARIPANGASYRPKSHATSGSPEHPALWSCCMGGGAMATWEFAGSKLLCWTAQL
jgi:hypothetical protein